MVVKDVKGAHVREKLVVADLLEKHDFELEQLREMSASVIAETGPVGTETDDLFLLRFLLSNDGKAENAFKSVKTCLEWRKKNLKMLLAAGNGDAHPILDSFEHFQTVGLVESKGTFGISRDPVFVVRTGKCDVKGLMKRFIEEDVVLSLLAGTERGFQLCDKITRETGIISKTINVIDMQSLPLFQMERKFQGALGKSSHISMDVYPQILGKTVLINVPTMVKAIIKVVNTLQSKKAVEKQAMCTVGKTDGRSAIAKCPFLFNMEVKPEEVPDFLGGSKTEYAAALSPLHTREGMHFIVLAAGKKGMDQSSKSVSVNLDGKQKRLKCNVLILKGDAGVTASVTIDGKIIADQLVVSTADNTVQLVPLESAVSGEARVTVRNNSTNTPCTLQIYLQPLAEPQYGQYFPE